MPVELVDRLDEYNALIDSYSEEYDIVVRDGEYRYTNI